MSTLNKFTQEHSCETCGAVFVSKANSDKPFCAVTRSDDGPSTEVVRCCSKSCYDVALAKHGIEPIPAECVPGSLLVIWRPHKSGVAQGVAA